jgi:hypothetical protein
MPSHHASVPHTTWYRVEPRVLRGNMLETFGGVDRPVADNRVVEFAREAGELVIPTFTTSYSPADDPDLLGNFLATFASPQAPTDEQVLDFYRQYGKLGDETWQERLSKQEREELPRRAQHGLREPVWYTRELAVELQLYGQLYWGLAEGRPELIREVVGPAPSFGLLVEVMVLGGEVRKPWMSEEESRQRVGSFGDWSPSAEDPGREFTAEECLELARSLLAARLNAYEARSHRQWGQPAQPSPREMLQSRRRTKPVSQNPLLGRVRTVAFDSLITALYLQLSDGAERGRLLRRCQGCQRFFWPDRPNQDYCKTRCANAYRRRQFTRRHQIEREDHQDGGR